MVNATGRIQTPLPFDNRSGAVETPTPIRARSKSSIALSNLRGMVILIVLAFHSVMAYLNFLVPSAAPFDLPPYQWQAFPIIDSHRWIGFDIFCAWQDVYLMALMFFLSALFTWSSLQRKGTGRFLADRFVRLGLPFAFALVVVMPIALYPVYRLTALDTSVTGYLRHYQLLPFWPAGPMWFLWQLLALTVVAAGVHRFAPQLVERLGRWSASAGVHPGRYFLGLAVVAALAYVPMALAFTPMAWANPGPFSVQLCRPLLYGVFYFAGLGVGAYGIERGLLAPEGMLARRWAVWLAAALGTFVLWMGLTALSMWYKDDGPLALRIVVDGSFAVACASGGLFVMAVCLRFATSRSRVLDYLSSNAFGLYVVHYAFVVWLQHALLGVALFAVAKAAIVFGGTLALACATTMIMSVIPGCARLIGVEHRVWSLAPARRYAATSRRFPANLAR